MGTIIELTASDGHKLSAYRVAPQKRARGAVVVIQEIFGVNRHIKSVVDGYAADGYMTIAPALFDRVKRNVELGYTPDDIAAGIALKGKASLDGAMRDVEAASRSIASAGKVGIVGYCWGGFISWMASAQIAGLACAVPYYGGGILDNANIAPKCPVMAHFGERDAMIPVAGVKKLAAQHASQQIFIYPADHGFNCDQRGSYDAESAKLARQRTLEFFRKHLG
jgi:carboxymethylenebutenolidase